MASVAFTAESYEDAVPLTDRQSGCQSEQDAPTRHEGGDAQITEKDRAHMLAFPAERRAHIMVDVMSRPTTTELNLVGDGCYARAISEARLRGLNLIDLQPMETAFLAVWHSDSVTESRTLQREVVAQMLWEQDGDEERFTVKIWGP